jgi:glycerol-3-phosphate acyltransferase PlsY
MISSALLLLAAYLLGAIPTGLLIGKWFAGIDLREQGSKNIGFTNAVRVLGWKLGLPVLFIDVGKGYVAAGVLPLLAPEGSAALPVLMGLACLVGNLFNVFMNFRGGKGVATAFGVFLALAPIPILIALGAFLAVLALLRYVSLGSIVAAVTLCVSTGLIQGVGGVFWFTLFAAFVVIVKHRANIRRLLDGTENRVGGGKKPASAGPDPS